MSQRCEICKRGTAVANNVSHSNIHTKRVQRINLHRVRAVVNGEVKRIKVCSNCLGKVQRPPIA